MVDAEAAVAAAQKLADQYASQAETQGQSTEENGQPSGQKRKFEEDESEDAAIRKKTSFSGIQDGDQVNPFERS